MNYNEMTIQELRAAIAWRRNELKGIYRIASFLTPEQLKIFDSYAVQIDEMRKHINDRKRNRETMDTSSTTTGS